MRAASRSCTCCPEENWMSEEIKGYRDLTQGEIDGINRLKSLGDAWGATISTMRENKSFDQRWVSIGETHLQQGVMALIRAVAKPDSF
jgi:hypothetical protein